MARIVDERATEAIASAWRSGASDPVGLVPESRPESLDSPAVAAMLASGTRRYAGTPPQCAFRCRSPATGGPLAHDPSPLRRRCRPGHRRHRRAEAAARQRRHRHGARRPADRRHRRLGAGSHEGPWRAAGRAALVRRSGGAGVRPRRRCGGRADRRRRRPRARAGGGGDRRGQARGDGEQGDAGGARRGAGGGGRGQGRAAGVRGGGRRRHPGDQGAARGPGRQPDQLGSPAY